MTRRILVTLLLCAALTPAAAFGETPCSSLDKEAADRYNALGDIAAERYGKDDYAGAIESILELKELCSEDPRLDYNLARAYQRAENCNMARFWFEEVLAREEVGMERDLKKILKRQKKTALKSITELEQVCADSARVSITCADQGVSIALGEAIVGPCPMASRVSAGDYELVATWEGHDAVRIPVSIVAGNPANLYIPPMRETLPDVTTGQLTLSCDAAVTEVTVSAPGLPDETWPCPETREVPPGVYTLQVPGQDRSEDVEIALGANARVRLGVTTVEKNTVVLAPDDGLRIGAWTSLGVGVGAVVTGMVLQGLAIDQFSDAASAGDITYTPNGVPVVMGISRANAEAEVEAAQDMELAGWIAIGVGGAAITTGIFLLIFSDPDEPPPADLGVSFSDDHLLLNMGGRF